MAPLFLSTILLILRLIGTITAASSQLRASNPNKLVPPRQLTSYDAVNLCFCEGCNSEVQETLAAGHSCRKRVEYLMFQTENPALTEIDACRRVAGTEFPEECGACDPDTCQVQSSGFCEVPTCTAEILETLACDETLGGCYQCGERIRYLVDFKGYTVANACQRVAALQFPDECGRCAATPTTNTTEGISTAPSEAMSEAPSKSPVQHPSASPSTIMSNSVPAVSSSHSPSLPTSIEPTSLFGYALSPDTTTNVCGTATCTLEVLERLACDDSMGGCFTCSERINYLIQEEFYSPSDACEAIGYSQFMWACGGCMPDRLRTPIIPVDPSKLVWSDEFDYDGTPDPNKWTFDIGAGDWGWGNNELQYYTDRLENAYVQEGILHVRAVKEAFEGGKNYTSARLKSKLHGDWTYGRVQVRARLQKGSARGTWAAAWMLSTEGVYGGWPDSGEIDILEHVGYDPGVFHGTVHTEAFNHMKGTQNGGAVGASLDDWHVFEIDWNSDEINFIMDDFRYHVFSRSEPNTFREWPFDERFHVILNLAVGGNWGGIDGIDEEAFQGQGQILEIDWVRVYSL